MIAISLNQTDKKIQINILLHIIGPDTVKVHNRLTWAHSIGVNLAE